MSSSSLNPIVAPDITTKIMLQLRRDPLGIMLEMMQKHGNRIRYEIGGRLIYQLNDAEAVQQILQQSPQSYRKTFLQGQARELLGNGLITSEGEAWRHQRTTAQPAFHSESLAQLAPIIVNETDAMLERWEKAYIGMREVDLMREFRWLMITIMAKTLFSVDISTQAPRFNDSLYTIIKLLRSRKQTPPWIYKYIMLSNHRFNNAVNDLRTTGRYIIDKRRADPHHQDLFTLWEEADYPPELLLDEVMTFLIAGQETQTNILTWAWIMLSTHPNSQTTFYEEVNSILSGRLPITADLPHLAYTQKVIQETMRLYPSAWILGRRPIEPVTLDGHTIEAGTRLLISPYVIHRNPNYWHHPETFQPRRFDNPTWPTFAYIPFGAGARQCIGKPFALFALPLILATIAVRFHIRLVTPSPIAPEALLNLRPSQTVKAIVTPR